jgi:hypothetical protein
VLEAEQSRINQSFIKSVKRGREIEREDDDEEIMKKHGETRAASLQLFWASHRSICISPFTHKSFVQSHKLLWSYSRSYEGMWMRCFPRLLHHCPTAFRGSYELSILQETTGQHSEFLRTLTRSMQVYLHMSP